MNASRESAKLTESPLPETTSSGAGSMRIVERLIHVVAWSRRPTCGLAGVLALTALLVTPSVGAQGAGPSHGVPGALPRGFVYQYNDDYHGWPIAPVHEQHPVRSSFLDPRGLGENGLAGYHFGIDISVDDRHPDPGAPSSLFSHRVYAVENGLTHVRKRVDSAPCPDRLLAVGHFAYLHVSPTVPDKIWVHAGDPIGWTCRGEWHVHLSEWQMLEGRHVWVNPLHAGGKLLPYVDTAPPVIRALVFVTPPLRPWHPRIDLAQQDSAQRLSATDLYGRVELRAEIGDLQSFGGWLESHQRWQTRLHPYRVAVSIRSLATRALVLDRIAFQSDQIPRTPYLVHYAPGTVENVPMWECVFQTMGCTGELWFRPFSRFKQEFWDTRQVPDGPYEVVVRAWDVKGNMAERGVRVFVLNR
jgi:hypothetical protein